MNNKQRLQELKIELEAERISYGELLEITAIAEANQVDITNDMTAGDIISELEELEKIK